MMMMMFVIVVLQQRRNVQRRAVAVTRRHIFFLLSYSSMPQSLFSIPSRIIQISVISLIPLNYFISLCNEITTPFVLSPTPPRNVMTQLAPIRCINDAD